MGCNPVNTVTMRRVAILFVLVLLFASGCSRFCRTVPEPEESRNDVTAAETPPKTVPATWQAEPTPPSGVEESRTASSQVRPNSEKDAPGSSPAPERSGITPLPSGIQSATAEPAPIEPVPKTDSRLPEVSLEEPGDGIQRPSPELSPQDQHPERQPPEQPKKQKETAEPPLDLDSLEQRLRETRAIGVFTKLALKNQVDDLLDKFRAFYQGRSDTSLAQLRQPFEMLIMKILALLQDSDPILARDLLESREAIWKVLSDREKFTSI